jgi:hypothetical protein
MKLNQLSVFLENKPGKLSVPCKALAKAGINILTLSLADTHQFGILRLVLPDWQRARKVLEDAGCVVNVTEVVAIEVPDKPGGLARVTARVKIQQPNVRRNLGDISPNCFAEIRDLIDEGHFHG